MRPTRDLSITMLYHLGMNITPRMDLLALQHPQNVDEERMILRVMAKIILETTDNKFDISPPFIDVWTSNSDVDFCINIWPTIEVSTIHHRPLCGIHPAGFEGWLREIDLTRLTADHGSERKRQREDEEMIAISIADQSWS